MTSRDVHDQPADLNSLLAAGIASYSAGRAADSRAAFEQAVRLDPSQGEAWYHLGLLHYAVSKDFDEAAGCFRRSIGLGHRVENANSYLLKMDAVAAAARSSAPPDPAPHTPRPSGASPAGSNGLSPGQSPQGFSDRYGVYEVLSLSDDPLIRQPLAMMDALRIVARPRPQAFALRYVVHLMTGVVLGYVLAQLIQTVRYAGDSHVDRFAGVGEIAAFAAVFVAVAWAWTTIEVRTTRYVLDKGRFQQTSGVLHRTSTNLELFRVKNVRLTRDVLQLAMSEGVIVLVTDSGEMSVTGLATGTQLESTYHQLLDLVFALRANNYVRGLIS